MVFPTKLTGDESSIGTMRVEIVEAEPVLIQEIEKLGDEEVLIVTANKDARQAWLSARYAQTLNRMRIDGRAGDQVFFDAGERFTHLSGLKSWEYLFIERSLFVDQIFEFEVLKPLCHQLLSDGMPIEEVREYLSSVEIRLGYRLPLEKFDKHELLTKVLYELTVNSLLAGGRSVQIGLGLYGRNFEGLQIPLDNLGLPFEPTLPKSPNGLTVFFSVWDDVAHEAETSLSIVANLNSKDPISTRGGGAGFKTSRRQIQEASKAKGDLVTMAYKTGNSGAKSSVCVYGWIPLDDLENPKK